ncbi:Protein of unknown function [Pyronema omphalodes CBS 100304]|uniref:Uncharacterized protein n=1 Tax=Pyronema omphalodes (strain CBS 100304) TaxID=1076935 RepID=U4KWL8_PYROM|nr:Protein of unknown function [Pyronema omphalodes CBS 100304]
MFCGTNAYIVLNVNTVDIRSPPPSITRSPRCSVMDPIMEERFDEKYDEQDSDLDISATPPSTNPSGSPSVAGTEEPPELSPPTGWGTAPVDEESQQTPRRKCLNWSTSTIAAVCVFGPTLLLLIVLIVCLVMAELNKNKKKH